MTTLTTHVLDQVNGLPGSHIKVEVFKFHGEERLALGSVTTNDDGRTDAPLLSDATPGKYELVFHVGDYFRSKGLSLTEPAFLDDVVIRFGLAEGMDHYHVPLLASPYGYTTYRGS